MRVPRTAVPSHRPSRGEDREGHGGLRLFDTLGVNVFIGGVLAWLQRHQDVGLLVLLALGALALVVARQLTALLALAALALLLWDRLRRRRWLRQVALRIEHRQLIEKLEVDHSEWGELSRAINGLLQEQHTLRHNAALQPASLPPAALAVLRDESLSEHGWRREVAVLMIGAPGLAQDELDARSWQRLAQFARVQSERHEALLLPCAMGLQLVFGVFSERPVAESLKRAFDTAQVVAQAYAAASLGRVAIGLASGRVTAAMAPGLGFCVLGSAVEQALALQRLALADDAALLCGERDYLRLPAGASKHIRRELPPPTHLPQSVQAIYRLPLKIADD